jgi:ankyrin repeat protein
VRFRILQAALLPLFLLAGCAYPIVNAASDGDTQEVRRLLQDGCSPNAQIFVIGIRPLTVAAGGGHLETVKVLLDHGADINAEDFSGWTALHAAAMNGRVAVVRYLLEHGAIIKGRLDAYRPSRLLDPPEREGVLTLLSISEK